jgi:hypothetical protein
MLPNYNAYPNDHAATASISNMNIAAPEAAMRLPACNASAVEITAETSKSGI